MGNSQRNDLAVLVNSIKTASVYGRLIGVMRAEYVLKLYAARSVHTRTLVNGLVKEENRHRHRPVLRASSVESLDNESSKEPHIL